MKRAIYPGSFDPLTNGHVDIIERALLVFDGLIIALSHNQEKSPAFSIAERKALIEETFYNDGRIEVCFFDGLLVDFTQKKQAPFIVRGLRATSDFEYEFQLASMNRSLRADVDTVFFMSGSETYFISSRLVKEVAFLGGDVRKMVPPPIAAALAQKSKQMQER